MASSGERDRLSERLTRGAPLAVFTAGGLLVLYQLLPILKVIAVGLLLALVLRTVVNGLERLGSPPWLSVTILLAGIGAFLTFGWLVIAPRLIEEARILVSQGPGSLSALGNLLSGLPLISDSSQILGRLSEALSGLLGRLSQIALTAASVLAGIVAAIFLAVFFAVRPGAYVSGVARLVPRDRRDVFRESLDRLGRRLRGWVVGTVLVAAFVGTLGGVGLWILGVSLPLTFGIIAGVLNVVPYLGSIVGGTLPALVALTISPVKALFVIINQIEGNILQPVIMGNQIRVPEAMILISILVLGTLVGPVIGTLIAVPTAVLVSVVLDELAEREPSLGEDRESLGESRAEPD